jgi:hypothetical protein
MGRIRVQVVSNSLSDYQPRSPTAKFFIEMRPAFSVSLAGRDMNVITSFLKADQSNEDDPVEASGKLITITDHHTCDPLLLVNFIGLGDSALVFTDDYRRTCDFVLFGRSRDGHDYSSFFLILPAF